MRALETRGFPNDFVEFVKSMYTKSTTVLEVNDETSTNIVVKRGVRQGDPLSSPILCIVADELLKAIPKEVGYSMDDVRVNATAYADDINIITSTRIGMQTALRVLEEEGEKRGLILNKAKCTSISIVPAGKVKKLKIITEAQFKFNDGSYVKLLKPSESIKYLFRSNGNQEMPRRSESGTAKDFKCSIKTTTEIKGFEIFSHTEMVL